MKHQFEIEVPAKNRWVGLTSEEAHDEVEEAINYVLDPDDASWDFNITQIVEETYAKVMRDVLFPKASPEEFWKSVENNRNDYS